LLTATELTVFEPAFLQRAHVLEVCAGQIAAPATS
jgi:hypothetical protein